MCYLHTTSYCTYKVLIITQYYIDSLSYSINGICLEVRNVWHSPIRSSRLVSTATNNAEKAMFSPVCAPTVAHNPVVHAILTSPAVELHPVVGDWRTVLVGDDAASILLNTVRVDQDGDRTSGIDLSHDVRISIDVSIFTQRDLWIVLDRICNEDQETDLVARWEGATKKHLLTAFATRITIHAGIDIRALITSNNNNIEVR